MSSGYFCNLFLSYNDVSSITLFIFSYYVIILDLLYNYMNNATYFYGVSFHDNNDGKIHDILILIFHYRDKYDRPEFL